MASADDKIKEVLGRYDEQFHDSVWRVQGTAVIYHKTLERIATKADIVFERPQIIRAERDEAVILVVGKMGDNEDCREEWSIGECVVNVNYRVSGKQAAYPFAMAEKRAKDRVILKLIALSGLVYSEDESDDFKRPRASQQQDAPDDADNDDSASKRLLREMSAQLWKVRGVEGVKALTDDVQFRQQFRALEGEDRARLGALIQERRAA